MKVKISPSKISGKITAPPSKSMAHRYLICAALADGESVIKNIAQSEDILATIDCLTSLGAEIGLCGDSATVRGIGQIAAPKGELLCRESGSTLRFLMPICLSRRGATFSGSERLLSRPLGVYEKLCRERGIAFSNDGKKINVGGGLCAGNFSLDGGVSSQFISGLLFALPTLTSDSKITLTGSIESRPYIDMTMAALASFGVFAEWTSENEIFVKGGQKYAPADKTVEGDCSNAAFFEALNAVGGSVFVDGTDETTVRGDGIYKEYIAALTSGAPKLSLADCPDLGPVMFALAAEKNGATFTHTRRLREKESDRIAAMNDELSKFGAELYISENEVEVKKAALRAPSTELSSHNDHRIAMALSVLLTKYGGVISGAEAVKKSMPDFFDELASLGAEVEIYDR